MILSILFYIFIAVGIFNTIHIAAYLIGANIYDAQALLKNKKYSRPGRKRFKNPLISILVPAYNEELSIERCLDSIRKSSYRKYEVIVNNDASRDKTAYLIKQYIKKYPNFPLRLVNRRKNSGKANGLNYIAKNYAKGNLVMTLDADSLLHRDALKNVIKYFDNPTTAGVAANVRIFEELSILGLLQRFEHMISYRAKKLYTVSNCELIVGGVASTYRSSVLKKVKYYDTDTATEDIGLSVKIASLGNKMNKLVYASDVVAMTEGAHSFKALLNQRYRWKLGSLQNLFKYRSMLFAVSNKYTKSLVWYRMPVAYISEIILMIEPIILAYILYISIKYATPILVLSAYGAISLYLLLVIWPDEHLNIKGKARISIFAPMAYLLFYIMNVVQIASIAKCLINFNKVLDLSNSTNSWISPKRSGKSVVIS